ncbi:MAG: ankyrin repeat domain-containing protein [Bacteroidales bacterium]|nr:ankyrin repeat domain-containing protein [Bacteroidales bacterium]
MSVIRLSFLWISIFGTILYHSEKICAQNPLTDSTKNGNQIIDISDYLPSVYPEAPDYNLMIAASKGYTTEIVRLIKEGADINAETEEGVTPLIYAVIYNRLEAVQTLLSYKPLLDKTTWNYETALLIAVKNRNFKITEALIRAGAQIDYPDGYGATALHYASINGYLDIVDLLLYYDAKINSQSVEGTTPLLASIQSGYADVADLLIQNGADIEKKDNNGISPFLMAAYYGDTLILDLLYMNGANIYAMNNSYCNALTLSILAGHSEATEFLLKTGDKWAYYGKDVVDPYRIAAKYRRKEIATILKNNNFPGKLKFGIDQVSFSVSSRFSMNDIYTGVSLSFKEPFLNGGFIAGYDTKLWYTRLLMRNSENLFYQYLDKGSVAYIGLFKDLTFTDYIDKFNYSVSTSLLAGYSFGNKLKGTLYAPENKYMIVPSISFKMTKNNFSVFTGIEYMKTAYYHNGPIWFRIGCSGNYFFDNIRANVKPVKWH